MLNTLTSSYAFPFKDFTKSLEELLETVNIRDIHLDQMDIGIDIHSSFYHTENNPELYKALAALIENTNFYQTHKHSKMAYYPIYSGGNMIYGWGFLEQANDNLIKIELTITDTHYSLHSRPYGFSYTLADKIILESAKITDNSYLDGNHCDLDDPDDIQRYKGKQYDAIYEMACSIVQGYSFQYFTTDFVQEKFRELIQIGKNEFDFTLYNSL